MSNSNSTGEDALPSELYSDQSGVAEAGAQTGKLVVGLNLPPNTPAPVQDSRKAVIQVAESVRKLSVDKQPADFSDNKVGSPTVDESVMPAENVHLKPTLAPQKSESSSSAESDESVVPEENVHLKPALVPQRSESSSSAESDEQLEEQLKSAKSDSEKLAIRKDHGKEQRKQIWQLKQTCKALEQRCQSSDEEKEILELQLQLATERCQQLSALLDDAKKEGASREDSLRVEINGLEQKCSVLQKALGFARAGQDLPSDVHLKLIQLGCNEALTEVDSPVSWTEGTSCPFSSLNNHEFFHLLVTNLIQTRGTHCLGCHRKRQRINSHPYGKSILLSAAAFILEMLKNEIKQEPLFWLGNLGRGSAVTAEQCTYPIKREAFCGECDNSTSLWERAFSEQFESPTGAIEYEGKDITKAILLIQMFRGALLSIDIPHFMECEACTPYLGDVGEIMLDLMRLHHAACAKKSTDVDQMCEKLKPIVNHNVEFQSYRKIMYPTAVHVKGFGVVLYAQIPPYYWAVPAPSCECVLDDEKLWDIADQITNMAESTFKADSRWKGSVPQPVLVLPLFDECCVKV